MIDVQPVTLAANGARLDSLAPHHAHGLHAAVMDSIARGQGPHIAAQAAYRLQRHGMSSTC